MVDESKNCLLATQEVTGVTQTRIYRGDVGEGEGVWRLRGGEIPIDTYIKVELGNDSTDLPSGYMGTIDENTDLGDGYLAVGLDVKTYTGRARIYDDQADARNDSDNYIASSSSKMFTVASKINDPEVKAHLATADVAAERAPFLEFTNTSIVRVDDMMSTVTPDVGVLATISVTEKGATAGLLDPNSGKLSGDVLTGAKFTVTTAAGGFGFGNRASRDEQIKKTGDDPDTDEEEDDDNVYQAGGPPTAFMVSSSAACMDAPLKLFTSLDPVEAVNPLAELNPTFADQATIGYVKAAVANADGPIVRYLCVLVDKNMVPIPNWGDKADLDGYKITVIPTSSAGDAAARVTGVNAGSIDRNGTTVNVAYLQTDPEYQQRLVIVNRGGTEAMYQMDSFQHEAGVTVDGTISGMVPGNSRVTIDVLNALTITPESVGRTAGTLTLTAPEASIDVMTVQQHRGSGQVDTTLYPNDG